MGIVQHFRSLGDDDLDEEHNYEYEREMFIQSWKRANPDENIENYQLWSYTRYGNNYFRMDKRK